MAGIVVNPNLTTSNNVPVPLSNYLGAFETINEIQALAPVAGNEADLLRDGQTDQRWFYDSSDQSWRPYGDDDFRGYYTSLQAVKDDPANVNPQPTWVAVNSVKRVHRYVVYLGEWIEEPKTFDAAYLNFLLNGYLKTDPYKNTIEYNSKNQQQIINDLTVDFQLSDKDFRKTFIHTGTGTINILVPAAGLQNAFVAMFKVEGSGNILLVAADGVTLDLELLLTDGSGILERAGSTNTYYTNGSFE